MVLRQEDGGLVPRTKRGSAELGADMQKKMVTLAPFIFHIFNSFFALHVFESPWLWDKKPLKHHSPQSNMSLNIYFDLILQPRMFLHQNKLKIYSCQIGSNHSKLFVICTPKFLNIINALEFKALLHLHTYSILSVSYCENLFISNYVDKIII